MTDRTHEQRVVWHGGRITSAERSSLLGQHPVTIWMTGLSGAGKSTLAFALEARLNQHRYASMVLDGDNVRHGLCRDLGFSEGDRRENIRRVAEVAHLMNEAGLIVIAALISPYDSDRRMAAEIVGKERFHEVHLSADLEICERRDPKGMYRRARSGEITSFTGISAPYETPDNPSLRLDTGALSIEQCVDRLQGSIAAFLQHPDPPART